MSGFHGNASEAGVDRRGAAHDWLESPNPSRCSITPRSALHAHVVERQFADTGANFSQFDVMSRCCELWLGIGVPAINATYLSHPVRYTVSNVFA